MFPAFVAIGTKWILLSSHRWYDLSKFTKLTAKRNSTEDVFKYYLQLMTVSDSSVSSENKKYLSPLSIHKNFTFSDR